GVSLVAPLLYAVQQRGIQAVVRAEGAPIGQDVIERVREGAILPQPSVGAASLVLLRLGAAELAPAIKAQVGSEVHPPVERVRQMVIRVHDAEYPGAHPLVRPVLDV